MLVFEQRVSTQGPRTTNLVVSILIVVVVVLGILVGYLYSENLTLKAQSTTITKTETETITKTYYVTMCSPAGTASPSTKLVGLENGLNQTSVYYVVRNNGSTPIYVKMVYVNCDSVYFNGTDVYLSITNNPIMPNQEVVIAANYRKERISGTGGVYFTIVTEQGERMVLFITVLEGPSTSKSG